MPQAVLREAKDGPHTGGEDDSRIDGYEEGPGLGLRSKTTTNEGVGPFWGDAGTELWGPERGMLQVEAELEKALANAAFAALIGLADGFGHALFKLFWRPRKAILKSRLQLHGAIPNPFSSGLQCTYFAR